MNSSDLFLRPRFFPFVFDENKKESLFLSSLPERRKSFLRRFTHSALFPSCFTHSRIYTQKTVGKRERGKERERERESKREKPRLPSPVPDRLISLINAANEAVLVPTTDAMLSN